MAYIYFGADYPPSGYENVTRDWNDITQWFSNPGAAGEGYFYYGTPLNRLPDPSDTIEFKRQLYYNAPSTWTGATVNLKLGEFGLRFAGNWSGSHTGYGMVVYGTTSSTTVISGNINNVGGQFFSCLITGNIVTHNYVYLNDQITVTGNISGVSGTITTAGGGGVISGNLFNLYQIISNGGTISGNITGTTFVTIQNTGTVTGGINARNVRLSTSTVLGSVTATNSFFMSTGTFLNIN